MKSKKSKKSIKSPPEPFGPVYIRLSETFSRCHYCSAIPVRIHLSAPFEY